MLAGAVGACRQVVVVAFFVNMFVCLRCLGVGDLSSVGKSYEVEGKEAFNTSRER